MGYTFGGRIVEFEELPTDDKLVVVLQAVNQLEFTIRGLSTKIDSLINKQSEINSIQNLSAAKPCVVCGKKDALIVHDRVAQIMPSTVNYRFCGGCRFCADLNQLYVFGPTRMSVLDQWNAKIK